jgi:hypothetical protein
LEKIGADQIASGTAAVQWFPEQANLLQQGANFPDGGPRFWIFRSEDQSPGAPLSHLG